MTTAVVFAYSEVGVRCLRVLLHQGVTVPLVFTHEDDSAEARWYRSVAELARNYGIHVVMPNDPNADAWVKTVAQLRPQLIFSFYYRRMLCDALRRTACLGALNMHGSLLPKYRGRAPVNWAILRGERETGASLHHMEDKPDAGALVGQERVPIGLNDTALDVSFAVAEAAERLLDRCLPDLIAGRAIAVPQELSRGSYFGGRRPEDGRVSWGAAALDMHNLIRAVAPPFPGAFGDCGELRFRFLGSRYAHEPARFADLAPCLYAEQNAVHLDCVDARRLTLTAAQLNGESLTPPSFNGRFPSIVLSLRSCVHTE